MRIHCLLCSAFIATLALTAVVRAKETKRHPILRDGSTQARAIIVTEPDTTYVHWEWQYLRKTFPEFTFLSHGIIPDKKDPNRGYDLFEIIWRGDKREVWFDSSKPFQQFWRKHG